MKQRIIFALGRKFKFIRKWYWKKNGGAYPWGLYRFVDDNFENIDRTYKVGSFTQEDFEKMFNIKP